MSDFEKKVKKLKELDDRITAEEKNGCIYLSGEVDDWNTVVKAGRIAVDKKYIGVVNDVKLKGFVQKQYVPPITDNALTFPRRSDYRRGACRRGNRKGTFKIRP